MRALLSSLVRLYYPDIVCEGRERLPRGVPIVFVPNHPNALLDPLVLRLALEMPVRFLAKSTLFRSPLSRVALDAFGALPVHRQSDGGDGRADKNEETFAECRAMLARGEPLALFPEGTSHSDPTLKPLKTGAARIALSAERQARAGLVVVPVGLSYEAKATFRSKAVVTLGEPIAVSGYTGESDEKVAVQALTKRIREGLDAVVAQAETEELLVGARAVAAFTGDEPKGPSSTEGRLRELLAAYRHWQERDPERVERVVGRAQRYIRTLRRLGVSDPWALEMGSISAAKSIRVLCTLFLLAPLAAVGALAGWVPYRLAGRAAARVAKEPDTLGTTKLLGGALFLALAWSLEAAALGWLVSPAAGALAPLAFAACGYAALRFDEIASESFEALRMAAFRSKADVRAALAARRRELTSEIEEATREPLA